MTYATLALDLGTTTGWAYHLPGGTGTGILSGTSNFAPKRFEGGGMRYLRFRHFLSEFLGHGLGLVVYEEVRRHLGTDAAHVYGGFQATLSAWCEDHVIPYKAVPVGTIKQFATGKGNAGKEAMIEAAIAAGFSPKDDNEADAIHLLRLTLKEMGD